MDEAIAVVAAVQHGAFTAAQARAAGFTPGAIRHRLATGRWIVLHRGVYAIAGLPHTWEQNVIAGVLAAGEGAAASFVTASVLWRLIETTTAAIHVTVPSPRRRRKGDGIVPHSAVLSRTDVRTVNGIPTTAPNRTLVDLAGVLTEHQLEDALDKAIFLGLTSLRALDRYISTRKLDRLKGVGLLRRLIADRDKGMTQSELERVFLRKVRKAKLPEPTRQFAVGNRKIDIGYPDHKVIIELDGHGTRYARRDLQRHDRRQNEVVLKLPGWTLLRFTKDDVANDWSYVEATMRDALA